VLTVSIVGETLTQVHDALVDSGADDTVFHESVAGLLGIDLHGAPSGLATGVGLQGVPLRYAEVTLRIADVHEQREWRAWVGFTPVRVKYPLLGFAGFLQFFTATFDGEREQLELSVNNLYPGT
jgi:hypothetical protein